MIKDRITAQEFAECYGLQVMDYFRQSEKTRPWQLVESELAEVLSRGGRVKLVQKWG